MDRKHHDLLRPCGQGGFVFVSINLIQRFFLVNTRFYYPWNLNRFYTKPQTVPFEEHIVSLGLCQEKVLIKLVNIKGIGVLQLLSSKLHHIP